MTFVRPAHANWRQVIPGSRWYKADLHTHTLDDHPGGRLKLPHDVSGAPQQPDTISHYARRFLQGAIRAGVQVLGLTPHAVRLGATPDTSAVWHIVDAWSSERDDDGVPFHDKIFAVFPGFEPNVHDGRTGVHLAFLFDPEIGRDRYLALFDAIMDGRAPWKGNALQLTSRSAEDILRTIDERQRETRTNDAWDYLVFAPHFRSDHGLLHEVHSQVLEVFPCHRLAAYELGDDTLPTDFRPTEKPGKFLLPFMEKHRQAFFHASDAYAIPMASRSKENEIGYRVTWLKLASPRIEALRQALIAQDSRLRIGYTRDNTGVLRPLPDPPDPLHCARPWLRRLVVRGEAAFFGGTTESGPQETAVSFSPDLTCIIGGSMTGKSTLLDGLRVFTGAEMPSNERLRADVVARGSDLFLAGRPHVTIDTPGRTAGTLQERWPALFFGQNELQRLAREPGKMQEILARLVPAEREAILDRDEQLSALDADLRRRAQEIGGLLDRRSETEQQLITATKAQEALQAFEQAGLAVMQGTEDLLGHATRLAEQATTLHSTLKEIAATRESGEALRTLDAEARECLSRTGARVSVPELAGLRVQIEASLEHALRTAEQWATATTRLEQLLQTATQSDRTEVERRLAQLGYGAEQLAEFKSLSEKAGPLAAHKTALAEINAEIQREGTVFAAELERRETLVREQRASFDRVAEEVRRQFGDRIRVRRVDCGHSERLEAFLHSFRQKGITQWWNGVPKGRRPSPAQLYEHLEKGSLDALDVSPTVAERFGDVFTAAKRNELRALRSPDHYILELRVGDGDYRAADKLSGGKRVSLLLSLLLEAHDERPLVIDQPEDELDNRFLWETVLPALRRLKGRRQVIIATHSADIVVNGDADLVVQLEAEAQHGRVALAGAIEDPAVRKAIIETVDGGERAFELRKAKYGF